MTKVRKVKRRKTFQANVNRKRLRNKLNKLPTIKCKQIKDAWEVKRSIQGNLKEMGLAADPNKVLKIPNSKKQALENVSKVRATEKFFEENVIEKPPSKVYVAESLEKEAKAPRERMFKLPKNQVQFITYMMSKYGDDYKAMTRDKKNYYQLTWKQMRAKVNTFKNIPEQYAEYLLEKGEIVLDDPISLAESKKQQALENFQKHCVSKKPKANSKNDSQWEEESINPTQESGETISDNDLEKDDCTIEEKLNLFLDEENDTESKSNESSGKKTGTVSEASNGILQSKSVKNSVNKTSKNDLNSSAKVEKVNKKRMSEDEKKLTKRAKMLEKSVSSDSECEYELEGEESNSEFVNLSDLSDDELSDDDILDDGEFVSDSDDESD